MRALSRLLTWKARLRALWRARASVIEPSQADYEAFALDRYSPEEQREIVKLIARQPVIGRGDIAGALERARRKTDLSSQLTGVATGVGFVAMFALGIVVAGHEQLPTASAEQPIAAGASPSARDQDEHWSPGGLDEADREFFADLQTGRISTASDSIRPRPSPATTTPRLPAAPPALAAAAPPARSPAPKPVTPHREAVIQLGAFADAAAAKTRWQTMATQFSALRPLTLTISPIARGGRTLYRLQATGADAASVCTALTDAGATCVVITPAGVPVAAPGLPAAAQPAALSSALPAVARRETIIQLGAFADPAVAKARWQALAMQFPSLRPLTQTVSTVARGGRKIYRLRASGIDAESACSALAVAGATCFVATDAG